MHIPCTSHLMNSNHKDERALCHHSTLKAVHSVYIGTKPFWSRIRTLKLLTYTHAILWFPPSFLAVNHHNIKNWVPSILTHNLWLIFMGMKQKKIFFLLKKKFKMADSKKLSFSTSPKAEQFPPKFHRLVLGIVGLIDAKGINVTQPIWPWSWLT